MTETEISHQASAGRVPTRGTRHGARLLTAAVVLLMGVAVFAPSSAQASTTPGVQATPNNMSSHPWSTDGCSVVPDSGYWVVGGLPARYDFNHACIHHDGCYRGHWASRSTCDSWFRNDMRASCLVIHPRNIATRAVCYNLADGYYLGVLAFGQSAYDQRSIFYALRFFA